MTSTFSGSVPTLAAKSMNFWNCSFCLGVRFLVITYLSIGTVSTTANQLPIVPAPLLKGDPAKGKAVFASAGCGSCHTLAAAHSTGTIGPNLDQLKPNYRTVTSQVTNGGGAMPAFKSRLTTQQIADVSAYVVDSTGGTAP